MLTPNISGWFWHPYLAGTCRFERFYPDCLKPAGPDGEDGEGLNEIRRRLSTGAFGEDLKVMDMVEIANEGNNDGNNLLMIDGMIKNRQRMMRATGKSFESPRLLRSFAN